MAAPLRKFSQLKQCFISIQMAGKRQFLSTKHFSTVRKSVSRDIGLPFKLRTILLGPSLALLGFKFKKGEEEELSEKDQLTLLVYQGTVARKEGKSMEASQAFHKALTKSTDFLNEGRISKYDHLKHRVHIYDQIANLSMDLMDYKNAEALFKDTMKLALQLGMAENDNVMIEISLKLARIYLYTGRTDIAVVGLKHCITEQESKLEEIPEAKSDETEVDAATLKEKEDNTKVLLGMALKDLANHHLHKREFKKAESLMQRSLDISTSVLGINHDQTFVLMNDLATCQIMLEEYEKAETLLQEGVQESGKAQSLMQSAFLSNLGALYIRTRKYDKAKNACKHGLKVAEKGQDVFLKRPCESCLKKLEEIENSKKENN